MISTPPLLVSGTMDFPSSLKATPSCRRPNAFGMEGPVISASKIPTWNPSLFIAEARREQTVDLPTPPLPDTMPMTFFTEEPSAKGSFSIPAVLVLLEQFAEQEPQ